METAGLDLIPTPGPLQTRQHLQSAADKVQRYGARCRVAERAHAMIAGDKGADAIRIQRYGGLLGIPLSDLDC